MHPHHLHFTGCPHCFVAQFFAPAPPTAAPLEPGRGPAPMAAAMPKHRPAQAYELTIDELQECRQVFRETPADASMDTMLFTLLQMLREVHIQPTLPQEALKERLRTGGLSFQNFVSIVKAEKAVYCAQVASNANDDLLNVFVSLGGSSDRTGAVDMNKLRELVREFKLGVNLEKLAAEVDEDKNNTLDFLEFATILVPGPHPKSSISPGCGGVLMGACTTATM